MSNTLQSGGYVPTDSDRQFFSDLVCRDELSRQARFATRLLTSPAVPPAVLKPASPDGSVIAAGVSNPPSVSEAPIAEGPVETTASVAAGPGRVQRRRAVTMRLLFYDRLQLAFVQQKRNPARRFAVVSIVLPELRGLPANARRKVELELGRRLRRLLRAGDTVVRLKHEHVVMLHDVVTLDRAAQALDRLCRSLSLPFSIDGSSRTLGADVGMAVTGLAHETPAAVVAEARKRTIHLGTPAPVASEGSSSL